MTALLHTFCTRLLALWLLLGLITPALALDASKLLPPEQAFVPQVTVDDTGIRVRFVLADGYYLYRSKISATTTPQPLLAEGRYSGGKTKTDEFFGTQEVYYHQAEIHWPYQAGTAPPSYTLTLDYQGCADAGVCYPPVQTHFQINGSGEYQPPAQRPGSLFLQSDNRSTPTPLDTPSNSHFRLSWDTLNANLLAFFAAGIGLSLTACMYPLLPILSGIIVGTRQGGKRRALVLSLTYVQGLALTYTLVGIAAGLTGALLTVWLQQPWVVLSASLLMVALALAMFGVYNLQLPTAVQSYFQQQSGRLSGGKIASVFGMGMLSALIVGPCVAPPLAFALGYIAQTGDAMLGGLALYVLALGTGLPLIIAGTFGGHILPRAGAWMQSIRFAFGLLLLAAAVYLATPFLPYAVAAAAYTLLLVIPAGLLLVRQRRLNGALRSMAWCVGILLLGGGVYFAVQSTRYQSTSLHRALTLTPPGQAHFGRTFFHPDDLRTAIDRAFAADPGRPVWLDFYADWCVSCKEMSAYTFSDPAVQALLDENRFFQIDVTANTPAQQALLREYGLFGPPGLFALHADGCRSQPLLGFVKPKPFTEWLRQQDAH